MRCRFSDTPTAVRPPRFAQAPRVPLDTAVPYQCPRRKADTRRASLDPYGAGSRHPPDCRAGSDRSLRRNESGLAGTVGAVRVPASKPLRALRETGKLFIVEE